MLYLVINVLKFLKTQQLEQQTEKAKTEYIYQKLKILEQIFRANICKYLEKKQISPSLGDSTNCGFNQSL